MAAPSFARTATVNEYLGTSYEPDYDYVDGLLEDRNLGEYDHGRIQALLAAWFFGREREWGVRVVVEQRVQVSPTRFRVPDICVLRREKPVEQIVRQAPMICIEVLSPDDSVHTMRERIADYHRMGVEHVWLIDPASREGLICTPSGWNQPHDGKFVVPETAIYVPLAELVSNLD